ncbi:zinc finger CCHC-type and RNA-binding motif-containing protein 1-like [Vigna radiata var. radiata]|uniref:Zinc finger CCHC-type and RNA-binding motif-containing protein 1-like n=1 Tax=Vigna radiata var. radiata TaxID=3916 RepID=A0A1S3TBE7_VIGRR|nr:zinc finger CCHC-type and RNA-binding motif-containing protein 1-like [Vigna radiata var. radiata]
MTALFGKLREHELDLGRLNEDKEKEKKKTLAFKSEIGKSKHFNEEEDSGEDEKNMGLFIKICNKFMKSKGKRRFKNRKKENKESSSNYRCYGCGEKGHMNADCPNPNKGEERGQKKFFKKKKAYIAREEDN